MTSKISFRNCAPRRPMTRKADTLTSAQIDVDRAWMRRALRLAGQGLGQVWPNPAVGCLIVDDTRCIGRGRTREGGRPHAETIALQNTGAPARGATAYVTLEPCSHHGKTPPCADALIEAGIARIVVAMRDPDPRVNGTGISRLRDAGLDVVERVCADEAADVNIGFLTRVRHGRPFVTLKLAMTLDGRIAMASGESRWITDTPARRMTHMLRSMHDGIMVGRGTVQKDDPMLDVRGFGPVANPVRIVVDTQAKTAPDSKLLRTTDTGPVWIATCGTTPSEGILDHPNVTQIVTKTDQTGIIMTDLLQQLGTRGMTRVLCEGGGQIAASLLAADLVDELVIFHAGKMIGASGLAAIAELSAQNLADVPQFNLVSTTPVAPDIVSVWRRSSEL